MIQDVKDLRDFLNSAEVTPLTVKLSPKVLMGGVKIRTGHLIVHSGISLPVVNSKTSVDYFGESTRSKYAPHLSSVDPSNGKIEDAVFINGSSGYYHFLVYHCAPMFFLQTMPTRTRMLLVTARDFPSSTASLIARLLSVFSHGREVDIIKIGDGTHDLVNVIVPFRPNGMTVLFLSRQIILPFVLAQAGFTDPLKEFGPLKIFVRRESAPNGRNLSNQSEVEAWFVRRGYVSVNPGALTMDEQIILFSRATHIAGVEGGAMTNILFAVNARQIILIAGPQAVGEVFFASLVKYSDVAFHTIYGKALEDKPFFRGSDFYLPIMELEDLDDDMIS